MSTAAVPVRRPVLADLVPRSLARDVGLVLGVALLTAVAAQVAIPFWPVPVTGQTFAVLLGAAALGPARGLSAQAVYLLMGGVGLPFFTGARSGWAVFADTTGGYLIGFLVASVVVGWFARRGLDRRPLGTALAFAVGSLVIYLFGATWLAVVLDLSAGEALAVGVVPFLAGDVLKALLAAGLLPAAWRLTRG